MGTMIIFNVEPTPALLVEIYEKYVASYKARKNSNITEYLEKAATKFLTRKEGRSDYLEMTNNFAPWQKIMFAYYPSIKRLDVTPINHALSHGELELSHEEFDKSLEDLAGGEK